MVKKVFFLVCIISMAVSSNIYSQQNKADSCYLPLAIGSKWVFAGNIKATIFASSHNYKGIKVIEIKESKLVSGKEYYYFLNKWIRYDGEHSIAYTLIDDLGNEEIYCDFNLSHLQYYPDNSNKQSYIGSMNIMDSVVYLKGYIADSSGNKTKTLFSNNFGLNYFGFTSEYLPQACQYVENYFLVGVYNANASIGKSKQLNITPTFKEPYFTVNKENKLSIYIEVSHPYSCEESLSYYAFPYTVKACSFIDSVKMDYFYCNGVDTIRCDKIELTQSTTIRYVACVDYRNDLISNGYKIYYKITAKDINVFPQESSFPVDGYNELSANVENPFAFNPLVNSNMWVYHKNSNRGYQKIIIEVKNDTLLSNGLKYSKVLYDGVASYERIDSVTGFLIQAVKQTNGSIKEIKKEHLDASVTSDVYFNNFGIADTFICSRIHQTTTFGLTAPTQVFYLKSNTEAICYRVEGLGLTYASHLKKEDPDYYLRYNLAAARINGVVYGEQSLITSVEEEKLNQPTTISLSQNYPNPFNPNTTIEYSIPEGGMVELKVFDVLGREVNTLVNGYVQSGSHSVNFNASNLSSGVYFYSIKYAGKNTITKKMVLTK